MCNGRLLHADETKIIFKDKNGFVWVLANMEKVAYIYSETREGNIIHNILKDFTGVLVSDFYAAYDSIRCPQQKCLIHFIRDINDDLLKHPYDEEMQRARTVRSAHLVRPMVETVDRHGLKTHFLRKHQVSVERFYTAFRTPPSERGGGEGPETGWRKTEKSCSHLLSFDGVPWNNNNAEHAVKAFAALRKVIGGSYH